MGSDSATFDPPTGPLCRSGCAGPSWWALVRHSRTYQETSVRSLRDPSSLFQLGARLDEAVEHLVKAAQRGDARAFSALIARYERSVLAVAYSACGDSDRAADASQEAFLRAWRKLEMLQEPKCFGNWLLGI